MAIDSTHPSYDAVRPHIDKVRVAFGGEKRVKDQGFTYLPATSGQIIDGAETGANTKGWKSYDAYRRRAVFPDLVRIGVNAALGVMSHKPPVYELPARMEYLLERATTSGESLEMLHRRVNEEQLTGGRLGLLAQIQTGAGMTDPLLSMYPAECPINWDDGGRLVDGVRSLNFVVLDESQYVRDSSFEWDFKRFYRVLALVDPATGEPSESGVYAFGVFPERAQFNPAGLSVPTLAQAPAEELPFVFINSRDIVAEPENPPMLGLADSCMTIYRGEADLRQALFLQGQATFVTIGMEGTEQIRLGAEAHVGVPMGGDAKYVGVDSSGIADMRATLDGDYARAREQAAALLENNRSGEESGRSLRIRVSADTATLTQIAVAGAFGIETLLKSLARWMGLNAEEVSVTPNLDFIDDTLPAQEALTMQQAKAIGLKLSDRSIHGRLQRQGWTELSYEEELDELDQEVASGGSTNRDGPEDNEPVVPPEGGADAA